jgi:hypothetical protein
VQESNGSVQTWAVVTSDGQNYIGIVDIAEGFIEELIEKEGIEHKGDITAKHRIIAQIQRCDGWLVLKPAYEFYCPMGQDPETGQFGRRALLTHPDFVIAHQKVPLHLRINKIYFFDDLEEGDRKKYKDMIATADKQVVEARARASGLALVPPGAMPKGPARHG